MYISKVLLATITALGFATISACRTESPPGDEAESSLDAARHVDEIRSAFHVTSQIPVAAGSIGTGDADAGTMAVERHVTPVIGDSIATGYERVGVGLRMKDIAISEVDFELPTSADGARRLANHGVSISARLHAASHSPAEIADGYVLYRGALGERTSVVEQARADGVKDFFYFPERPASENIVYDLDLGAGVGGLRLVANTLEFLDLAGVPRLRVNPPIAVGADGAVVEARLEVRTCSVDTSPSILSAVRRRTCGHRSHRWPFLVLARRPLAPAPTPSS